MSVGAGPGMVAGFEDTPSLEKQEFYRSMGFWWNPETRRLEALPEQQAPAPFQPSQTEDEAAVAPLAGRKEGVFDLGVAEAKAEEEKRKALEEAGGIQRRIESAEDAAERESRALNPDRLPGWLNGILQPDVERMMRQRREGIERGKEGISGRLDQLLGMGGQGRL